MRFRRLSPEELHTWKKTKNKVRAIQKIKQEEDENAPDGIPFYEIGRPIIKHEDYVEHVELPRKKSSLPKVQRVSILDALVEKELSKNFRK